MGIELTLSCICNGFLFLGLLIGCAYQSYRCILLYNLKETSIKMVLVDARDERFPAVAVNPGFKEDVLGGFYAAEE